MAGEKRVKIATILPDLTIRDGEVFGAYVERIGLIIQNYCPYQISRSFWAALNHESGKALALCSEPANRAEQRGFERADLLLKAAKRLRDDMFECANWDDDTKVVCAGSGAWRGFVNAIQNMETDNG